MKSPRLSPAHVRDAVGGFRPLAKIEVAFGIVQVVEGPVQHPVGQFAKPLAFAAEEDNGFGRGVDINGIDPVVVILGGAVRQEKVLRVELHALFISGAMLLRFAGPQKVADRFEVEAGMEGIDPALHLRLSVIPGTVGPLILHSVGETLQGGVAKNRLAGHSVEADQQRGAEEVGIVDGSGVDRGVAEAESLAVAGAVQIVEQKVLDRNGQIERSLVAGVFPGVQQGVADEPGIDDGGGVFGNEKGPGLPVEIVAPAVAGIALAFIGFKQTEQVLDSFQILGARIDPIKFGVAAEEKA